MRNHTSHDGWKNEETKIFWEHLNTDDPSRHFWKDEARRVWRESEGDEEFSRSEVARLSLQQFIVGEVERKFTKPMIGLFGASYEAIDWFEIADSFFKDDSEIAGYEPRDCDCRTDL